MNGIKPTRFGEKTPECAFIFTGGKDFCPEKITDLPTEKDVIIAADSGCSLIERFCEAHYKIFPDLILGDMDSYKGESIDALFPNAKFVSFPPEKDDTDTALAVSVALEMGCKKIVIFGGLGGRLDHTLANVYLLEYIRGEGADAIITDGKNRAYLAKEENIIDGCRKYLSLIPLDECIHGVFMDKNFKYPFEADALYRKRFVTVSNEIKGKQATLKLKSGLALIVESGD